MDGDVRPVVYLSADQISALHRRALEDAYPTLPEKAAAYGFFIAENQPFIDGNKRTAAAAVATFLELNGHELWESFDTELAEVFEDLGRRAIDQSELFAWVRDHARLKPVTAR